MANSSLPDREKTLRWLRAGTEMARRQHGERATHSHAIWALLTEAVDLLDRSPDNERRWLTSGTRSGGIMPIGLSEREALQLERLQMVSAIQPATGAPGYQAQAEDHERMMDVMSWLRWCNPPQGAQRLQKAAVQLARGGDVEAVHRIYAPNRKRSRQTINEIRSRVAGFIFTGLYRDLAIVRTDGASFASQW